MNFKVNILFLLSIFIPLFSFSQEEDTLENQITYHKEITGMAFVHTHGLGLNLRKGYHITAYKKRIFESDLCTMTHAKDFVIPASQISETHHYVYGELNSVAVWRLGYGIHKLLAGKMLRNNVEIRLLTLGGLSLSFLKPSYFEIEKQGKITYERFNDGNKNFIRGGAPGMGYNELSIMPGAYGKAAVAFEYSGTYHHIRSLETGITFDIYYKDVPILADTKNYPFYACFYVGVSYGKKWYR